MMTFFKSNKDRVFVFCAISVVSLVFCFAKYGFFIDEIFTLGCANSHNAPFISMINGGNINNVILDRKDFIDYLTVNNNEVFDFSSVFYNLSYDTQPPFYFLLLNACSSLFQSVFSKWIGLGLNFILFWVVLFFLYKTSRLLDLNNNSSLITVILFGLSYSLMSNLLNIRMYILFVCLSIVLVYLFVLFKKTNKKYICGIIALIVFLGSMTQYIFLVFAFFLSAAYIIYFFSKKNWLSTIVLGISSLAGVALLLVVFPTVLKIIFSGGWAVSGGGMLEKLKAVSGWPISLIRGSRALITGTFVSFSLLIIAVMILFCNRDKYLKTISPKNNTDFYMISISALLTFVLVSIISPGASNLNYISNIAFVVPLSAVYLLNKLSFPNIQLSTKASKTIRNAVLVLTVVSVFVVKPGYINGSFRDFDKQLSNYLNAPCIYCQSENNNVPVSQDMAQLIQFKNVFITDWQNKELVSDYLCSQGKKDKLIVYIDATERNEVSPNEIINYLLNEESYSSYKMLYKYECSECYAFDASLSNED